MRMQCGRSDHICELGQGAGADMWVSYQLERGNLNTPEQEKVKVGS